MKHAAFAMAVLLAAPAARAQDYQGMQDPTEQRHSQTVQTGAGTDDETTTGSSGPQAKPAQGEAKPGPCDNFAPKVQAECLSTVQGENAETKQ